MSVDLTRLMAYPVHAPDWERPRGCRDYRITNPFDGLDLVNGGLHQAVDLGNFGEGDPLRAPSDCMARSLTSANQALGVQLALGGVTTLEAWHLSRADVPNTWTSVPAGEVLGLTGHSGIMPDGKPMPRHTHVELKHDGMRFDPAPYLLGEPLEVQEVLDMRLREGQALVVGDVGRGNRLRLDPSTADGAKVTDETIEVKVLQTGTRGESYTLAGAPDNRYTTVALTNGEVYYVAEPLVTDLRLKGRGLTIPTLGPEDVERARRDGRTAMREEAIAAAVALRA